MPDSTVSPSTFQKNMEIGSAISLLRSFVQLSAVGTLNRQRFETCRKAVLDLELPREAKFRTKFLFDSASRYMKHEEVGALKFELDLLAQHLRKQKAS